jgi:hypothetical protein
MPRIPRIGPGEVVPIRPVRPDDLGSGVGQAAYAGAVQDLGAISARLIGAEREAQVAGAEAGYGAKLAELTQQIEQHPNADEREGMFEEGRKALSEEFRGTLTGQQYQAAFDQRAFQLGERAKLAVREGVIRKRLDNARGGVIESVDKFDRLIEHSESDQLRKGYIFARSNILDAGVAGGSISAAERAQIEERSRAALEQVEMRRGSQERADALVAGGGSYTAQLAAAREIQDPQMRDLVTARVKDRNEEQRAIKEQSQQAQQDELWRRFWLPANDPNKLKREDIETMGGLDAQIRNPLMNGFEERARVGTLKTDPAVYDAAIDLYTDPRRADEAAKTPPETFFGSLALEQQTHVRELSQGKFDKQEPLINQLTKEKAAAYLVSGADQASATPEEKQTIVDYGRAVRAAIESERLRLGRVNLSQEEIEAVVDSQLEIAIPAYDSYFFDPFNADTPAVPRYQVPGQFIGRVPTDDYTRLRQAFRDGGVANPSDAAIRRAWVEEQ